ncbi:hypothetical protein CWC12_10260 [Pseudoalteromonas ruthenica]|nr:hypothetical protein CWC12_10260 [Pseudoalteromonas ruthenica]TMP22269.1 hypothetical protein CWC06_15750 [Pseudoalteromonas ruthenica]
MCYLDETLKKLLTSLPSAPFGLARVQWILSSTEAEATESQAKRIINHGMSKGLIIKRGNLYEISN